jgi:predicted CXXCH cytochrome family protein
MKRFRYIGLSAFCALMILAGCDPITRYKVTSTIFDGVPALPPPEQICQEFADKKVAEAKDLLLHKDTPGGQRVNGSTHAPYQEKRCDDCHDKTKEGGLIKPKSELCFVCHTNFVKGSMVHGPVATADCLACHEPHYANFPKLLKASPAKVCGTCHREKRVATGLHDKVSAQQMLCIDCHDPHYGNVQFFLK